jgi:hypothetical protein
MTVASTSTASPTIPIAVIIGGTAGDHGWWAEQAAQNGTDWAGVLDGARDLLAVAVGEVTSMHTFDRACREADRKAASRPVDARTLRARRLLADDDISYERAYYETLRDRSAPEGHNRRARVLATARYQRTHQPRRKAPSVGIERRPVTRRM